VTISSTSSRSKEKTVNALKDAIKVEKTPELDLLAADSLKLWRVSDPYCHLPLAAWLLLRFAWKGSFPIDRVLTLLEFNLDPKQELSLTVRLSQADVCYGLPSAERLHMNHNVVRRPNAGTYLIIYLYLESWRYSTPFRTACLFSYLSVSTLCLWIQFNSHCRLAPLPILHLLSGHP
jgi:hypothetical protein